MQNQLTDFMPAMKDKGLVKLLLQNGWTLKGTAGSHYRLEKNGQLEVVPVRGKDMKIGLLMKILERTGLKEKGGF